MKVEKGQVGAPETGRAWLNSALISLRQPNGRLAAFEFNYAARLHPGAIPAEVVG